MCPLPLDVTFDFVTYLQRAGPHESGLRDWGSTAPELVRPRWALVDARSASIRPTGAGYPLLAKGTRPWSSGAARPSLGAIRRNSPEAFCVVARFGCQQLSHASNDLRSHKPQPTSDRFINALRNNANGTSTSSITCDRCATCARSASNGWPGRRKRLPPGQGPRGPPQIWWSGCCSRSRSAAL